jgi:hypothetical protein
MGSEGLGFFGLFLGGGLVFPDHAPGGIMATGAAILTGAAVSGPNHGLVLFDEVKGRTGEGPAMAYVAFHFAAGVGLS